MTDRANLPGKGPQRSPPRGLFIAGTDTAAGKTRVAAWICRILVEQGRSVGVCKPAAAGAEHRLGRLVWDDLERLGAALGDRTMPVDDDLIGPFRWKSPLAPSVAQRVDGAPAFDWRRDPVPRAPTIADFHAALDRWNDRCEILIVEGVGGLLCPLTDNETAADLAKSWGRPLVVVARLGLGTLNHSLLTVETALSRGLSVAGLVVNSAEPTRNDWAERTNPDELRRRMKAFGVPVWGPVPHDDSILPPEPLRLVDWWSLAGRVRD